MAAVRPGETVISLLQRCVEEHPNRMFLDFSGEAYTYADVWSLAGEVAGGLRAAGVRPGDTVVSMLDNHVDCVAAWFGTNMLGAIWMGANTALKGQLLRHVIDDSAASVVICESDLADRVVALEDDLPAVTRLLHRGSPPPPAARRLAVEPLDNYRIPLDGPPQVGRPDDLTCLVYTGGTTGPSKGCMISHGYALHIARNGLLQTGRQSHEVNWSPLPMFHMNVLGVTIVGTMLVAGSAAIAPRFSVSGFWPEIERTGAQVVNLLGSMSSMIAQYHDTPEMERCVGQIRMLFAVPCPPAVQEVWRNKFGVKIAGAKTYGMTEVYPITTFLPGEEMPPDSAGRPNEADHDVRIVDDEGDEVAPGMVGEVVCRPKRRNVMFKGYWRRPEATVEATRDLWFHTGDLGLIDEDGWFYFVDRKNDYLRRRGENMSSQELEAIYLTHPAIDQVAVHAVPSEFTEDEIKVTAVLAAGTALTAEELFNWAKDQLPYFALPRYIEFRAELPVSAVGRVHKYQLRNEGCTDSTWDRETAGVSWERR
ncbi:MAG: AMP-binding protein [Actinomycetota bacterium]